MFPSKTVHVLCATAIVVVSVVWASGSSVLRAQQSCHPRLPFCFSSGSPARADQVNQNFEAALAVVPVGSVILWSGAVDAVPAGWALCDGRNGTPDLRNRFVVGAGDAYKPGSRGGADSVTLTTGQMPAHDHSASTGQGGSHRHDIQVDTGGGGDCGGTDRSMMHGADTISAVACNQEAVTKESGTHDHTVSVAPRGGGEAHENRPPFHALAYIMRTR